MSIIAPTACLNASSSIDDPPYRGVTETDKFGSGFVPIYEDIAKIVGPAARICELGVAAGYSLELWQQLFPQGLVAGVDNAEYARWPDNTICIHADQQDTELPLLLGKHADEWDLIIDDASHIGTLTAASLENLWPIVSPGGFYVIEDWFTGRYDTSMFEFVSSLPGKMIDETRANDINLLNFRHGLIIIRKSS